MSTKAVAIRGLTLLALGLPVLFYLYTDHQAELARAREADEAKALEQIKFGMSSYTVEQLLGSNWEEMDVPRWPKTISELPVFNELYPGNRDCAGITRLSLSYRKVSWRGWRLSGHRWVAVAFYTAINDKWGGPRVAMKVFGRFESL